MLINRVCLLNYMSVIKECELSHACLGYNRSRHQYCEITYNMEEKRVDIYNGSYICYRPVFDITEPRVEVFTIGMVYSYLSECLRISYFIFLSHIFIDFHGSAFFSFSFNILSYISMQSIFNKYITKIHLLLSRACFKYIGF
jgi:hypothetical protein